MEELSQTEPENSGDALNASKEKNKKIKSLDFGYFLKNIGSKYYFSN